MGMSAPEPQADGLVGKLVTQIRELQNRIEELEEG
jgi:hypothetical protein